MYTGDDFSYPELILVGWATGQPIHNINMTVAGFAIVVMSLVGLSVLGVGSHGGAY